MAEQTTDGCAGMGELTDAHKKFESFVGTFAAEVKLWMGPGEPHVSSGVMENTLDLGGRYLRQVYTGDPGDGPFPDFAGRGFWGYNSFTNKYEGFWIDTASPFMQNETGDVDASGKVWNMASEMVDPKTGQPMKKRSVITLQDDDHHRMEMFFDMPDLGESKAMEINYTRKT